MSANPDDIDDLRKTLTAGVVGIPESYKEFTVVLDKVPTLPSMEWVEQSFTFEAPSSGQITLQFLGDANATRWYGPTLDNVQLYKGNCIGS